jgi:hypothetical protein
MKEVELRGGTIKAVYPLAGKLVFLEGDGS